MVGISKLQNTRATTSSGDRFNPILSQVSPRVRQLMAGGRGLNFFFITSEPGWQWREEQNPV